MTASTTVFPVLTTGVTYVNTNGTVKAAIAIVTPNTLKEGTGLELDAELGQIVVHVFNVAAHDYSRIVASKAAVEAMVAKAQIDVQSDDSFTVEAAQEILSRHLSDEGVLKGYWVSLYL